ncbi:hypothetical protein Vadar_017751 [Vaccinium darrowii]|uniref:Uncharacterized protein n=1 Tax=Vaccinium darrowii TaxID=229202 RepID=A0ACB7XS26_9ERIC|nr:hypothetical protein Vadar_017751 [Vaccinium darrowii]
MFLALDKDMNGTLSKQEFQEYADGTLTDIFIERAFDEHVRRGKTGVGRGYLTTADIHSLFRDVHQKWVEGGNYELFIEDVRDGIWDMVKPVDPLRITLSDLLGCKQGGTVASMLTIEGIFSKKKRGRKKNDRCMEFTTGCCYIS